MIMKRNFPHLLRKLAILAVLAFLAYQLLLFLDQRQRLDKNEKIKQIIVQEKVKEKLQQVQQQIEPVQVIVNFSLFLDQT